MKRPEITNAVKAVLQRVAPDAITILYGSEARGDARSDSDIDLLILIDKDKITLKDRQAITYPLYDIELESGILISPKVFTKHSWEKEFSITPFYHKVMKEGIIL